MKDLYLLENTSCFKGRPQLNFVFSELHTAVTIYPKSLKHCVPLNNENEKTFSEKDPIILLRGIQSL